MSSNPYPHGVLGQWAVVCFGFNISSIVSSIIVIALVVVNVLRRSSNLKIVSFRIPASIAICDLIYSVCQICTYYNDYMSTRPEMQLRVIHWFMSATTVSFVNLSFCIGLQMLLNVVLNKVHIHNRISPYYELVSFLFGFIVTHPILYIYTKVQWATMAQVFHIYTEPSYYKATSWATKWVWVLAGCVALLVFVCMIYWRMIEIVRKTDKDLNHPEGTAFWCGKSDTNGAITLRHNISSAINRCICYPLVPIFTQTWILVANMIVETPMWLYVMASIIPATQGMLNLFIFINHPLFKESRKHLFLKIRGTVYKKSYESSSNMSYTVNSTTASLSSSIDGISRFDDKGT
ncbi:hypothetical protein GGI05_005847, partial [Coemansia sp. RSA 2603]